MTTEEYMAKRVTELEEENAEIKKENAELAKAGLDAVVHQMTLKMGINMLKEHIEVKGEKGERAIYIEHNCSIFEKYDADLFRLFGALFELFDKDEMKEMADKAEADFKKKLEG